MTLRRKTLLVTVAVGFSLILALYLLVASTMRRGYLNLEETIVLENASRLSVALENRLQSLENSCKDWSNWDATYDFIETRNQKYVEENLNLDTVLILDINLILFLNSKGEIVQSLGADLQESELRQLPDSLLALIVENHPLLKNQEPEPTVSGVVSLPEGILILSANPILKSDLSGPPRGTLIMGRYLDSIEAERLSALTQLDIEFYSLSNDGLPKFLRKDVPALLEARSPVVKRLSETKIAARFIVNDIFGKPVLLCSVESNRDIYTHGEASLSQYIIGLIMVSTVIVALTMVLLNHYVIKRVSQMQEDLSAITMNREFLSRISAVGSDELSELGHDINSMLETINQVQHELHSARINAESANQSKSEFLANMSHEIRTPMTAILGLTESMLDPDLSDSERLDSILIVRRNGEHLLQIINDILDISKIEAGKVDVENIRCCPIHLVADVKSLMQMRANAKNLVFNVEFIGAIPEFIYTDPTRLKQVLVNLLGNAIKFTEEGGVRLIISFIYDDAESVIQFDVLDTGIGLTDKQIDELFEPFNQADATTTRRFGGTGLGLAISRRLAQLLGGDLTVQSTPGHGSAFRLRIKTGPVDDVKMLDKFAMASITRSKLPGDTQSTIPTITGRLLLAEDNNTNRLIIQRILEKAGASVISVTNGKLAVEAALEAIELGEPFDVIIMDMQMPVMDGYHATTLLRQKNYNGPIIALTAHAMADDRQKCLDAGCDDFATKPINRKDLIETIQTHLKPASA